MAEAAVLIFLDIDGLLRRIRSPLDVLDADCLGRFEAVAAALATGWPQQARLS